MFCVFMQSCGKDESKKKKGASSEEQKDEESNADLPGGALPGVQKALASLKEKHQIVVEKTIDGATYHAALFVAKIDGEVSNPIITPTIRGNRKKSGPDILGVSGDPINKLAAGFEHVKISQGSIDAKAVATFFSKDQDFDDAKRAAFVKKYAGASFFYMENYDLALLEEGKTYTITIEASCCRLLGDKTFVFLNK